jgi:hypothetical protein
MSIPLNRLYHYIENVAKNVYGDVIIYRFWPHGSKKIEDFHPLHTVDWVTEMTRPHLLCNDQEPVEFDFYQNYQFKLNSWHQLLIKYNCHKNRNLYRNLRRYTIFDQSVLLHSEKRSHNVEKYQRIGFIPVYYWSHAVISLDWFRFAQNVNQKKKNKKIFLIYNRSWSGTREYRIKFSELLHVNDLLSRCQTSFNCIDPQDNIHYSDYSFKNTIWQPETDFSKHFCSSSAASNSSADFELLDYESTDIEVVLETLFDDSRLHFTEKILRPIALAQPFLLVGSHGGLDYLKSYGFKTFESIWDESYDSITDPYKRLESIIKIMKTISHWDPDTRRKNLQAAQGIADYNKAHFFSESFFNLVNSELVQNLREGLTKLVSTDTCKEFLESRKKQAQFPELKNILTGRVPHPALKLLGPGHPYQNTLMNPLSTLKVLHCARQYYNRAQIK